MPVVALLLTALLLLPGCGRADSSDAAGRREGSTATERGRDRDERGGRDEDDDELSAFELEHGIGPVRAVPTLGPVDPAAAEAGRALFEVKCSACHKMAERYVGPALGDVTARRSPAFILNMILNPQENLEHHPAAKQLLAEFMLYMPNQGLTGEQARQVLEYLRTQAPEAR